MPLVIELFTLCTLGWVCPTVDTVQLAQSEAKLEEVLGREVDIIIHEKPIKTTDSQMHWKDFRLFLRTQRSIKEIDPKHIVAINLRDGVWEGWADISGGYGFWIEAGLSNHKNEAYAKVFTHEVFHLFGVKHNHDDKHIMSPNSCTTVPTMEECSFFGLEYLKEI